MSVRTATDNFYSLRLVRLLSQDFEDWKAFELGLIDKDGNRIKKNKVNTSDERAAWTRFHIMARNLKKMLQTVPGGKFALSTGAGLLLLKEGMKDYGLSDEFPLIVEEMVSGDSDGDPVKIASGERSGAITLGVDSKKKKKKKK